MNTEKYPKIEEDSREDVVSEPSAVAVSSERQVSPNGFIPVGLPHDVEKALADIEEGEREFERGETYSHKEVMEMVWSQIDSYAG